MVAGLPEGLLVDRCSTPIGELMMLTDEHGRLVALHWQDRASRRSPHLPAARPFPGRAPHPVRDALRAYFDGELDRLRDIVCATAGTPFQRRVWAALREIAPGQTMSYRALAVRIGRPRAVRAVGLANGQNPIAIVVPCHRVIGSDGTLTGYGGGLERKRWLLEHEGVRVRS